jgi:AcrR family transcriptional regulator
MRIPPPARSARGETTRRRIILAAADLMAERGVDAVHPHEILEAAGQRNVSAIQYHFGSREGLIVAVLQPREDVRGPIEAERARLLAAFSALPGGITLQRAARAHVEPLMLLLETRAGRSFVRVASQVVRQLPLEDRVAPAMPSERRVQELLASHMPPMPERVRRERLAASFTMVVELVANRAREIEHGQTPNLGQREFAIEVASMTVGILSAHVDPDLLA